MGYLRPFCASEALGCGICTLRGFFTIIFFIFGLIQVAQAILSPKLMGIAFGECVPNQETKPSRKLAKST